jgi:hypothetical protein
MNKEYDSDEDFLAHRKKKRTQRTAVALSVLEDENIIVKRPNLYRKRWDLEYLQELAINENSFVGEYRLDPSSFALLHDMLAGRLEKNYEMAERALSQCQSEKYSTVSRLGAALIRLARGRNMEVMRTHGMSRPSAYNNLYHVCRAINSHPALEIKCDNTLEALTNRANGFQILGSYQLFEYGTAAIDGLSLPIMTPDQRQAGGITIQNTKRFFDGNKRYPALNVQVVCDAETNILAMTCMHVGSTHDNDALNTSSLVDLCCNQRFPFHWFGDSVYGLLPTLMTPFLNVQHSNSPKEWFSFYHSQRRIVVERMIGVLMRRWGIF